MSSQQIQICYVTEVIIRWLGHFLGLHVLATFSYFLINATKLL